MMMLNFSENGHPVLRGSSASEGGDLKSKGKGNLSIHFCGDDNTAEGSSHDHLRQSAQCLRSMSGHVRRAGLQNLWLFRTYKELVAQDNPETMVIPTELSTTNKSPRTDDNVQGHLLQELRTKIRKSSKSSSTGQNVLQCRHHEDRGEGTVFHDPRRCGTGQIWRLVESIHYLETTQHPK